MTLCNGIEVTDEINNFYP